MKERKIKNVFRTGAIPPGFVATAIANHQTKTAIGAHDIFLGQVRADTIGDKTVAAIEYTAHEEMANQIFHQLREATFEKFDLSCMHIYHSLGKVHVGELCFFVFVSGTHRKEVFAALEYLVEDVKAKVPIYGKEIFEDNTHQWKVNT
jgi:molybdopterin synthase catalytic subunit